MTRFEFGSRASLWSTFAPSKYVPAAHFRKTGMLRPKFDFLFRCIRFSDQPNIRPAGISAEVYWWKLVDDFVKTFCWEVNETPYVQEVYRQIDGEDNTY